MATLTEHISRFAIELRANEETLSRPASVVAAPNRCVNQSLV